MIKESQNDTNTDTTDSDVRGMTQFGSKLISVSQDAEILEYDLDTNEAKWLQVWKKSNAIRSI